MIENDTKNDSKSNITFKHPALVLILSLVIWIIFDQATWERAFGLQFLLTTLLILIGLFILIRVEKKKVPWASWLLLIPTLFGAVMTVIRREGSTTFFNIVLTLLSLLLIALTLDSGAWLRYRFQDLFMGILQLIASAIISPVRSVIQKVKQQKRSDSDGKNRMWVRIRPYLIGLLIAFPLVCILGALLSSADMVFNDRISNMIDWISIENLGEIIWRSMYIIILAYLLAGAYLHALYRSADHNELDENKSGIKPFLGSIEAFVVLGLVNLLFLSFIIIQFRYFFAGDANISFDGFTYAEYARRGFFELVAVALISLGIFYLLGLFTKRQKPVKKLIFSALGILLIIQVGFMLVSAFQRLTLYENAYGFTTLRTITHIFMIWLGVLLLAAVVMEVTNQFKRMALAIFLVFFGFTVTLNLLNVDRFIVSRNIEHAIAGNALDARYLVGNMSSDGIPEMFAYQDKTETPEELQNALEASLTCYYAANDDTFGNEKYWSEWHLSRIRAENRFDQEKDVLESYPFKTRSEKIYYEENGKEIQDTINSYFIIVDDVEIWCNSDEIGE